MNIFDITAWGIGLTLFGIALCWVIVRTLSGGTKDGEL